MKPLRLEDCQLRIWHEDGRWRESKAYGPRWIGAGWHAEIRWRGRVYRTRNPKATAKAAGQNAMCGLRVRVSRERKGEAK